MGLADSKLGSYLIYKDDTIVEIVI